MGCLIVSASADFKVVKFSNYWTPSQAGDHSFLYIVLRLERIDRDAQLDKP